MPKVVFVCESLTQGGSERQMLYACSAVKKAGCETELLAYSSASFYRSLADELGIKVTVCDKPNKLYRITWLRKQFRSLKPDLVVSLVKAPSVYSLIASALIPNMRFVLTWRYSNESVFSGGYSRLLNCFRKKILYIVCNSKNGSGLWIKNRPQDEGKVRTIYNLVKTKSSGVLDLGQKTDGVRTILVAARIQPVKNTVKLLEALHMLPEDERRKLKILWYGDSSSDNSSYRTEALRLADEYGLEDSISFLPAVKDIFDKMLCADIVALFSEKEGFPNAICEGMMAGKPIIMTKVSDYSVMVTDENGFLVEQTTAEGIADALKRAASISDEELAAKGRRSLEIARELFDNAANELMWADLVNDAMSPRG